MKSFDHSKASGPYSLPSQIMRILPNQIASILKTFFNMSLQTGKFPRLLKNVKVVPEFKNKGSPDEVNNYRPISLLSNINKLFEKLVYARVKSFLDSNDILFKHQFGFHSKHSTNHSLISVTEKVRQSHDEGKFSCGILIDFQKAFETVDHGILLRKLNHYGIRGISNR